MSRFGAAALWLAAGSALSAPATVWAQVATDSASVSAPADTALASSLADSLAPYVPHNEPSPGHLIRWYEPLAVVGGVGLLSLLDQPVADHFRTHRSATGQNLADAWARVGTPVVFGPVTVGLIAGGLIAKDREVTKSGVRLALSLALAGIADAGLKTAFGRERPDAQRSAFDFDPLKHFDAAFPSGHTTMAFAMAASLADDVRPTWAKLGLYGVATGVAVSRVYQEKHWVSDVIGGAALGIASAKLVGGQWRIFGIRAPTFLMKSGAPAIGWQFSFHE